MYYETQRLYLRVFNNSNLESVKEFWGDEEVMALCDGASSDDVLLRIIEGYRKCHEINGLSVYAVIDKESNQIIDATGFNCMNSLSNVELIYHFSEKYWGKRVRNRSSECMLRNC